MALDEYKKFHGIALAELLDNSVEFEKFRSGNFQVERIASSVNYLYMVNGVHGLYFKFSSKAHSPWRFTFTEEHLIDLEAVIKSTKTMHVVLICNFECIAVMNVQKLNQVISLDIDSSQWISVKSFHNKSLRIAGSKGQLLHTLSKSSPFNEFLDAI